MSNEISQKKVLSQSKLHSKTLFPIIYLYKCCLLNSNMSNEAEEDKSDGDNKEDQRVCSLIVQEQFCQNTVPRDD